MLTSARNFLVHEGSWLSPPPQSFFNREKINFKVNKSLDGTQDTLVQNGPLLKKSRRKNNTVANSLDV